jgi:hypothetical protein
MGVLVAAVLLLVCGMARGQETEPKVEDAPLATLHVYTSRVQIPVLVLSPLWTPMKPVPEDRFRMHIDSGPEFRPTHVRLEGDDPISLALVMDVSGTQNDWIERMDAAMARLAPLWLHPEDRISIYAVGCGLRRSALDKVADAVTMRSGVYAALVELRERRGRHGQRAGGKEAGKVAGAEEPEACGRTVRLWDSLSYVMADLRAQRGRRVVLMVSGGEDRGSKLTWNQVRREAQLSGVTVFGLARRDAPWGAEMSPNFRIEAPLPAICELSGGIFRTLVVSELEEELRRFVETVRGRYIVEFPRARNVTEGEHNIEVRLWKMDAYIRPGGDSFPLPDPKERENELTIPGQEPKGPTQGTRRVLGSPM